MQSLVTPFGYSAESCGYCKDQTTGRRTPSSRASYYLSTTSLTVDVYQALVDRGWRRSGTVCYKPDVLRHCCPHYTIRLPVASFTTTKDQRRSVNRWNSFVLGDDYAREATKLYPKSRREKAEQRNTFDLFSAVHGAEYDHIKRPPEPAHRFEVTLEPDDFTKDKYELFHNYQQNVHHEQPHQISQSGFKRFLCGSPLKRKTAQVDGKTQLLGSYHQCYRLDGRLIAMGILDLLPHCVSGVYFLYHSDFEKWNFGKISAVREATLALEGGYQYYYMGFYIHSCAKMRYKGDYRPQHVLDPETYQWNPLDGELRSLLDKKSYVSLSREHRRQQARTSSASADTGGTPDDADDHPEYPLPTAADAGAAIANGMSLFDLKVPGVMAAEEVERDFPLDQQRITARGKLFEAEDLMAWEGGDVRDPQSLKGIVAELVACVGPEVAREVVVAFS